MIIHGENIAFKFYEVPVPIQESHMRSHWPVSPKKGFVYFSPLGYMFSPVNYLGGGYVRVRELRQMRRYNERDHS